MKGIETALDWSRWVAENRRRERDVNECDPPFSSARWKDEITATSKIIRKISRKSYIEKVAIYTYDCKSPNRHRKHLS